MTVNKKSEETALARRETAKTATDLILTGGQIGGTALIDLATARLRTQYGETILAFVTGQMDQMMRLKAEHDLLRGHIAYIEQRLAAVDAGEFTVGGYPPRVHFNDPKLNDAL
jgi:hypothetical protein